MDPASAKRRYAEIGSVRKEWRGRIRVALVYPNRYSLGMSNLGFQTVYARLNALDHVLCERAFLPETPDEKTVQTIESERSLSAFDVVAFSVSYENDFPNLLAILRQAEIPLLAEDRAPPHPLVLAGGVACFLNPEPIAPFVDCFLLGEAEGMIEEFFEAYTPGKDRRAILENLARSIAGVYVPAFYRAIYLPDGTLDRFTPLADVPEKVTRRYLQDLSTTPTCTTVLTADTLFSQTYLVELARGCPHGCRFCSAGFIYRPPRFRPLALLERCLLDGARVTDKVGLVSTAVSDHPDLAALCRKAVDQGLQLSFSSLRTDALTSETVSMLRESRVKTATLAPDAGSERMRQVINKGIRESDVLGATELLVSGGIPNLKLYFMVGLPTETPADVTAIVRLCVEIKERFLAASRLRKKIGTLTVSLNAFVPKPFTPFQWAPMNTVTVLKEKFRMVREGLRRVPNVRVKTSVLRHDRVQAFLSRGDRRVARALLAHLQSGGNWPRTLKTAEPNADFYVTRQRSMDECLPWDFIDHGIRKRFLEGEYKRALAGRASPPCPMENCKVCGVCGSAGYSLG